MMPVSLSGYVCRRQPLNRLTLNDTGFVTVALTVSPDQKPLAFSSALLYSNCAICLLLVR